MMMMICVLNVGVSVNWREHSFEEKCILEMANCSP
jgi:hypothetical protein